MLIARTDVRVHYHTCGYAQKKRFKPVKHFIKQILISPYNVWYNTVGLFQLRRDFSPSKLQLCWTSLYRILYMSRNEIQNV